MPAAAVIPAPIAYIKVVAVKKLVVESVSRAAGSSLAVFNWRVRGTSCRWAHVLLRWCVAQLVAVSRGCESHRGALY